VNGVMVNYSATAPNLVYDNGTPCTVSAPFLAFPVPGTCNKGHEVYNAGSAATMPYTDDTFTGPDPVADLFAVGPISIEDVDLNSSGDFIYNISHPPGAAQNTRKPSISPLKLPNPPVSSLRPNILDATF
jgi:hypothetical protein